MHAFANFLFSSKIFLSSYFWQTFFLPFVCFSFFPLGRPIAIFRGTNNVVYITLYTAKASCLCSPFQKIFEDILKILGKEKKEIKHTVRTFSDTPVTRRELIVFADAAAQKMALLPLSLSHAIASCFFWRADTVSLSCTPYPFPCTHTLSWTHARTHTHARNPLGVEEYLH